MSKREFIEVNLQTDSILNHPLSHIDDEKIDMDFIITVKAVGILQRPVITRNNGLYPNAPDDAFVIVSGHRRIKAAQKLNIELLICELIHYSSEKEIFADYYTFNMQRGGR